MNKKSVLMQEESEDESEVGSDFLLHPDAQSCWITVGHISVYINRTEEGVVVDLYPLGWETHSPLASTYAFEEEAKQEIAQAEDQSHIDSCDDETCRVNNHGFDI